MAGLRPYLRLPWRSASRLRADLDEELRFYFDMRTRELVEQGMTDADARREAVREFGDVEYTKRYCLAEDAMSRREDRDRSRRRAAAGLDAQLANVPSIAGVRRDRAPHSRVRHRRQHGDLQRRERPPAA